MRSPSRPTMPPDRASAAATSIASSAAERDRLQPRVRRNARRSVALISARALSSYMIIATRMPLLRGRARSASKLPRCAPVIGTPSPSPSGARASPRCRSAAASNVVVASLQQVDAVEDRSTAKQWMWRWTSRRGAPAGRARARGSAPIRASTRRWSMQEVEARSGCSTAARDRRGRPASPRTSAHQAQHPAGCRARAGPAQRGRRRVSARPLMGQRRLGSRSVSAAARNCTRRRRSRRGACVRDLEAKPRCATP